MWGLQIKLINCRMSSRIKPEYIKQKTCICSASNPAGASWLELALSLEYNTTIPAGASWLKLALSLESYTTIPAGASWLELAL